MKKNEAINFAKQHKSTVCLNEKLEFIKIVDTAEQDGKLYFIVLSKSGGENYIPCEAKIIPLKGRLKERDYNHVEAQFYKWLK